MIFGPVNTFKQQHVRLLGTLAPFLCVQRVVWHPLLNKKEDYV